MRLHIILVIISFTNLLYSSLLREQFWYLDPIHGATLIASNWIKNLQKYGNRNDPIVQLAKNLFHLDGIQLLPTKTSNHLGSSLTPELIAQNLVAFAKEDINKLSALLEKTSLYTSRQRKMLKILKKALSVSNPKNHTALYMPHTPHKLFLGFLFLLDQQAATQGEKIAEYFKYLHTQEPDMFASCDYSLGSIQKRYYGTSGDQLIQELSKNSTYEKQLEYITQHPFRALRDLIFLRKTNSSFPPQITEKEIEYNSAPKRPNCVEAALLDLVSLLLYNIDTKSYDSNILPSSINLHTEVKKIFSSVTPATIDNYDTHKQWCTFLWGKPDIFTYRQKEHHYEVAAFCPDNILAAFNHIFGLSAKTYKDLGNLLSSNTRTIESSSIAHHNTTIFTLQITDSQQRNRKASLTVEPKHAQLTIIGRDEENTLYYDNTIPFACIEMLKKEPTNTTLVSLLSLTPPSVSLQHLDEQCALPLVHHILFTADFTNSERVLTMLQKSIPHIKKNAEAILPLIHTMLPKIDIHHTKTHKTLVECIKNAHADAYDVTLKKLVEE
jgi:hypothetical protein